MRKINTLFSFRGRVNRRKFYIFAIPMFLLQHILMGLPCYIRLNHTNFGFIMIIMLLNTIAYFSFIVRRLHDIGRSGLQILIPFYNMYVFALGLFMKGESKSNKYGENPLKQKG